MSGTNKKRSRSFDHEDYDQFAERDLEEIKAYLSDSFKQRSQQMLEYTSETAFKSISPLQSSTLVPAEKDMPTFFRARNVPYVNHKIMMMWDRSFEDRLEDLQDHELCLGARCERTILDDACRLFAFKEAIQILDRYEQSISKLIPRPQDPVATHPICGTCKCDECIEVQATRYALDEKKRKKPDPKKEHVRCFGCTSYFCGVATAFPATPSLVTTGSYLFRLPIHALFARDAASYDGAEDQFQNTKQEKKEFQEPLMDLILRFCKADPRVLNAVDNNCHTVLDLAIKNDFSTDVCALLYLGGARPWPSKQYKYEHNLAIIKARAQHILTVLKKQ